VSVELLGWTIFWSGCIDLRELRCWCVLARRSEQLHKLRSRKVQRSSSGDLYCLRNRKNQWGSGNILLHLRPLQRSGQLVHRQLRLLLLRPGHQGGRSVQFLRELRRRNVQFGWK